jgi:tetratricopeptide (TPR) repeat protein
LNFQPYSRLGRIYRYQGKLAEGAAAVPRGLDLAPDGIGGHMRLADVLHAHGEPQAALAAVQQEPDEEMRLVALARVYRALGGHGEADAALSALTRQYQDRYPVEVAEIYAQRGSDRAFVALDAALAAGDPDVLSITSATHVKPIEADPRLARAPAQTQLAAAAGLSAAGVWIRAVPSVYSQCHSVSAPNSGATGNLDSGGFDGIRDGS